MKKKQKRQRKLRKCDPVRGPRTRGTLAELWRRVVRGAS